MTAGAEPRSGASETQARDAWAVERMASDELARLRSALAVAERELELHRKALKGFVEREGKVEAALREARAELTDDTDSWEHGRRLPGPTDRERIDNALAVIDAVLARAGDADA